LKLDTVVINDEFYKTAFKDTPVTVLSPTEILEYAQDFQAPVFRRIEDIKKKIQKEKDKKLNMILVFAVIIFILNLVVYFAFKNAVNSVSAMNNSLVVKKWSFKN
jgi:hypothetical protein